MAPPPAADVDAVAAEDTAQRMATMPPPLPPPLPPTLAELFEREEIAEAARLLRVMDSGQTRAEIPQAFAHVPSAPSCFLRCMRLWTQPSNVGGGNALAPMLGIVETVIVCVRSASSQSQQEPPSISERDAQLAGELLPELRECRTALVAGFALAFRVPEAVLADFCLAAVRKRVYTGVQLLEALRMKHLVAAETVLRAAIKQDDIRAGDLFVKRSRALQEQFVHLLLALQASDKVVKKRISDFRLDAAAFPEFVHRRKLAALRYLIYSEQYDAAAGVASESRELQEYACRVLVQKRGTTHAATRAFVRLTGCAQAFPDVDVSDNADALLLPPRDEYEPLTSCLSLVDAVGAANIVFVDTREALDACVAHLETQRVVGFDCEWKATHVAASAAVAQTAPCATLQLASAHRAFVLDVLALDDGDLSAALAPLFRTDAVLKLAFAAQGDLKLLRAVLGARHGDRNVVISGLLDLQTVARKLYLQGVATAAAAEAEAAKQRAMMDGAIQIDGAETAAPVETVVAAAPAPPVERPRKSRRGGGKAKRQSSNSSGDVRKDDDSATTLSLTGIAQQYLGKPLDKRARMSDWERRPLTRAQLEYAALDAHVLVQVLAAMRAQHAPELLDPIMRRCTQKNVR